MLDVRKEVKPEKGIVFGAFDLLHAGHIHLFKQCKMRCNRLIVAVHVDPSIERPEKNKPIESLIERIMKLKAVKYIDQLIFYEREDDIALLLRVLNIDVRFLGTDYKIHPEKITTPNLVPIQYINSLPIHTSDIRERIKNGNN